MQTFIAPPNTAAYVGAVTFKTLGVVIITGTESTEMSLLLAGGSQPYSSLRGEDGIRWVEWESLVEAHWELLVMASEAAFECMGPHALRLRTQQQNS